MQGKMFHKDDLDALCVLIAEAAKEKKDRKVEVSIQDVQNSGERYTGFLIKDMGIASSGVSYACPIVNADQFYGIFAIALDRGNDRRSALQETARKIFDLYEEIPEIKQIANIAETLKSWDNLKKEVVLRAAGKKKNKEYLEDKPHAVMGDICAVYGVEIGLEGGVGFCAITNEMLENIHVSAKRLHAMAVQNTMKKYPMTAKPMANVIASMGVSPQALLEEDQTPMYVLSNDQYINGASCLFYQDFTEALPTLIPEGGVIIPSSKHELLYVPCEDNDNLHNIEHMVREINHDVVSPTDQLSDKPFVFDGVGLKPEFGKDAFELKFKEGKKKKKKDLTV